MAEIVLFHHVLGLSEGVSAFADSLRAAGHHVLTPDLFEGLTFQTIEDGIAHAEKIGFAEIVARGQAAVAELPGELVYGGISMGALPAQKLTQKRPGAKALLLYEGGVPLSTFGAGWPDGVPLQIHAKKDDEWAEVDVLRELAASVQGADLNLYEGDAHLFTDASLDHYDHDATALVIERTLAFLSRLS